MNGETAPGRRALVAQPGYFGRILLAGLLMSGALVAHTYANDSTALRSLELQQDLLAVQIQQTERLLAELRQRDATDSVGYQQLSSEKAALEQQLAELARHHQALLGSNDSDAGDNVALQSHTIATAARDNAPVTQETKPLRSAHSMDIERLEASQAAHLRRLLQQHDTAEQEAIADGVTAELRQPQAVAHKDAQRLARIPYSVDKVRLNGAEGSTALSQISQRLADPAIPESRRDTAPILVLKTRLFGKLVASERRSLRPVGKHHYVARLHLHPGDTSISILGDRWEVRLPEDISARDYLVTLYRPPGYSPEFHLFSVDDLLAEENAHIPAWLPPEFKLARGAG
jgi:hypothetical protein